MDQESFEFISPGLQVARSFRVQIDGESDLTPYHLDMVCVYNALSGKYEVRQLTALPQHLRSEPINAIGLRRIRVQEIVRSLAQSHVRGVDDDWRPATESQRRPRTDAEYRDAAREYVAASIVSDPPLERITDVYGVSKATATRIVAEARRRGFSTGEHRESATERARALQTSIFEAEAELDARSAEPVHTDG